MKAFFRAAFLTVFLCVFFVFGGCYLPDGTQMQGCNMQACTTMPTQGCVALVQMDGEYKFYSMSYEENGMLIEIKVGEKFMNAITLTEDYMTMTLNKDGTAKTTFVDEEVNGGTWKKIDESHVEITFEGDPVTVPCDGQTLTIEEDGAKIVLKKK